MTKGSVDVRPLLDPRNGTALSNLQPLNELAGFLAAHDALLENVDVVEKPDQRGAACKITIDTKMPIATEPGVYEAMTNAGFRIAGDKKLSFVCSGEMAINVAPVVRGRMEATSDRQCHAYNALKARSPATLRSANARAVVNRLQKLLQVERWLELSVFHERRRLTLPWRLPSKYGDMIPVIDRLLLEDSLSGMICFFYAYEHYVQGYAFSVVDNAHYCAVSKEGSEAFYPAMNKLSDRFRTKVEDVCKAVPSDNLLPYTH
jgi:hypothetical protein